MLLAMMVSARAQTATNAVPPLSLPEARRLAFERNWDWLAARSGVDAATAQLLMVKELPNPTFNWNTYKIGANEGATSLGNGVLDRSYDTIAAINQLLEIGGKRKDRQAAARAGVFGANARFLDARRTLDQGVTKAYVAALLADENERVLHESAGYMRHQQKIAELRFKAGDLAESDLKQIQVAAEQYVKRYQEQIRPQSASARASVVFKFEKGGATLVDLLEAERTDNDVRLATAQAMADTASTAADLTAARTSLTETELNLEK
jgi:outer membrane protein TolC